MPINAEGMTELEKKLPLGNHHSNNSGNNHQCMLKLEGEGGMRNELFFIILMCLHTGHLLIIKGKTNLQWRNLADIPLIK